MNVLLHGATPIPIIEFRAEFVSSCNLDRQRLHVVWNVATPSAVMLVRNAARAAVMHSWAALGSGNTLG